MLKPCVPIEEFRKYGFKPMKGEYGIYGANYLCVSRGVSMIFLSKEMYSINDWKEDDPRIHKHPNCRYGDWRTALDITYELIKAGMLECVPG